MGDKEQLVRQRLRNEREEHKRAIATQRAREQLACQQQQQLLADIEALMAKVAKVLRSWDWSHAELSRRPGMLGALLSRIATLEFTSWDTYSLRLTSSGELYVYDYMSQTRRDLRNTRLSSLLGVRSAIERFLTWNSVPD